MANTKSSDEYYEYATVDTAPGAAGYFTNPVSGRHEKVEKLFFSIREPSASVATVTIQFKCTGDAGWQDYTQSQKQILGPNSADVSDVEETFIVGNRIVIEDSGPGVQWRAGVKQGDYTSGTVTFGFDW